MVRRSAIAASRTISTTSSRRIARAMPTTPAAADTLIADQPIVRRLIQDSLRYWVTQMHVDGFRFDLASILSRDEAGRSSPEPAGSLGHRSDPRTGRNQVDRRGMGRRRPLSGRQLRGRRLAGMERPVPRRRAPLREGRQRHGPSPGGEARWAVRTSTAHKEREAEQSINFVTCHDGFTLNDLVSYNSKHNEANGENNRDGSDDNASWNCGMEGRPTIRKSRRCGTARSRTSSRCCCSRPARRCC